MLKYRNTLLGLKTRKASDKKVTKIDLLINPIYTKNYSEKTRIRLKYANLQNYCFPKSYKIFQ